MKIGRTSRVMISCGLLSGALLFSPPGWAQDSAKETNGGVAAALELQNAFTTLAEKASPAVVVITNKQAAPVMGGMHQIPPEFRFFFGIPEAPEQPSEPSRQIPRPAGRGSGVIISADGYIVTNFHVIDGQDALEVKLHDGTVYDSARDKDAVQVVGVDQETDLAVLKIGNGEVKHLPILDFADSAKVRVGEWVMAIGAPFNFDYSVTVGVISQKGRYNVRMNAYENYLQTDASINPGNSGGPLINLHGEVVGINNFIVTGGGYSRGNVGLGFAIASNLVKQVVEQIIATGEVTRPWLGIAMQELNDDLKAQFGVDHGVLISDVMEGDPAAQAGLKPGDVILEIGGKQVRTAHDVQFAVLHYQPGDEIEVLIDRKGEKQTIKVIARRKDSTTAAAASAPAKGDILSATGLQLEETPQGIVIAAVLPGSQAAAAMLQRGDIILEVNRMEVKTVDEVTKALNATPREIAVLYIGRRGSKFFVPINVKTTK